MNVEAARAQMLGQQLRAWEVLDERVLDAVRHVRRERFVPEAYADLAFADTEIPLAHGQRMMTPSVEGRLLQALDLDPADTVLEVGTGSGFLTACLAALAGRVVSVDIFAEFTADAAGKLRRDGVHNVELRTADALALDGDERFDAIAVTGSVPELDDTFVRLLRPGGRLFVVVGRTPVMDALLIGKDLHGNTAREILFETVVSPLVNAERPEPFVL
ncbi:MAG: protein-L-isoaspartate O-methyltransferase [Proteobacteria bacterium]|nr:protein-L-isoaspartate O-methyltransferase [Pseudomonadota bacterium]MYJ94954.1 protein-L-isoaspartate O-methyltransferase [Pseudomonadota bacterium]